MIMAMKKIKKCQKCPNPELHKLSEKGEIMGDMTISEVVGHFPETMPVFMKHGMTCFGCPMALSETVAQGAQAHGMNAGELVEELNKAAKTKKKK